jgi:hypothetical protein
VAPVPHGKHRYAGGSSAQVHVFHPENRPVGPPARLAMSCWTICPQEDKQRISTSQDLAQVVTEAPPIMESQESHQHVRRTHRLSSGSLEACNHTPQPGSGYHGNLICHRIFFEDAERFHRVYGGDNRTVAFFIHDDIAGQQQSHV